MEFQNIIVEKRGRVGLITLNRPDALNALNAQLIDEIGQALASLDNDPQVGAMVLTGSTKAFAAGADIKEMKNYDFVEAYREDFIGPWDKISTPRKPVIAAVSGYALGGGCELALMCDFILASATAKFGQPEITIGIMPGAGGSQRLTRLIGKSKAMEMCLTGRTMGAEEAERVGLVSRIVDGDTLVDEAVSVAEKISRFSQTAVMMTKDAVKHAYEVGLSDGIKYERRSFYALFATQDQEEGMEAFVEKREPNFTNR